MRLITPPRSLDEALLLAVSVARYGRGLVAWSPAPRPPRPVELYDMEACPYCRKVREALSELDLDYVARTCGRGAKTRAAAIALGGKRQFPLLHDPNAGVTLYESEDIIDHLWSTYGPGRPRWERALHRVNTAASYVASSFRVRGFRARPGQRERVQPPELLVLYNFEASPWCRRVREVLNELDLHHHVKNVAKASPHRAELVALGGKMQVPYLVDPNTGTAMYESADIVRYLERTYR
ncbi:MAG: glutathione S-transferase N-terminal domain-containing protein [Deltaproteobacteria bacterium]|nr:glutathione S-transferase N-terminal domain-containing protein [Deltaproteobacteria bacterium]